MAKELQLLVTHTKTTILLETTHIYTADIRASKKVLPEAGTARAWQNDKPVRITSVITKSCKDLVTKFVSESVSYLAADAASRMKQDIDQSEALYLR